jgi:DNA-binding MarR family transcriptional regulator
MQNSTPFLSALHEWIEVFMRRSMRGFILYSKASGLSMSQIHALFQIQRRGSNVSDIGDELGVTNAAASQLIERLVQEGTIVRSEDPHDRRVKQLVLTEKGLQILKETAQSRQAWLSELNDLLSPAEQEQVIAVLRLLIEKINQLDQTPSQNEIFEEPFKV